MCDPVTILSIVGGVGSALFGAASAPPAPEIPAAPAPTARAPGATVRIGTGATELENKDDKTFQSTPKIPRRASAQPLGGLGQGSLAL